MKYKFIWILLVLTAILLLFNISIASILFFGSYGQITLNFIGFAEIISQIGTITFLTKFLLDERKNRKIS